MLFDRPSDYSSIAHALTLSAKWVHTRADLRGHWLTLHSYCYEYKTGGIIDHAAFYALGIRNKRTIDALEAAGFIERVEGDGQRFRVLHYDLRGDEWRRKQEVEGGRKGGLTKAANLVAKGPVRRAKGSRQTADHDPDHDRDHDPDRDRVTGAKPATQPRAVSGSPPTPPNDLDLDLDLSSPRGISEGPPPPSDRRAAEGPPDGGGGGLATRVEPETEAAAQRTWDAFPLIKTPADRWPAFLVAFAMLAMNAAELADCEATAKRTCSQLPAAKTPNPERWLKAYWYPRLQRLRADEARANAAAAAAERARLRAQPPQLAVIAGGDWPDVAEVDPRALPQFVRELAEAKGGAS